MTDFLRTRTLLVALTLACFSFGVSRAQGITLGLESTGPTFLGRNVGYWAGQLATEDRANRRKAIAQMLEDGKASAPVLSKLLESKNARVRNHAASTLSRIGPSVMPLLAPRLRSERAATRFKAVCVFRNFGREAGPAAKHIARLLQDDDPAVSSEAARSLAMMGDAASPAVPLLAKVLSHRFRSTRVMAAGALSSIGPKAAPATSALIRALRDKQSAVRRCAADALGAIGPGAAAAIDALIQALRDKDAHVRLCAAGALGQIGTLAESSIPELKRANKEPALETETRWAIERITGEKMSPPLRGPRNTPKDGRRTVVESHLDKHAMLASSPHRNNVVETPVPTTWNLKRRQNLRWLARLGDISYGAPVVADGAVYVGTSNENPRNPKAKGKRGVLMAFRESDGEFLWQDTTPHRPSSFQELLLPVTSSSPLVEGERLYYVNGQAQLRCLDTNGFRDERNNGPFTSERFRSEIDADIIWELDLCTQLGVFPHEAANCSVVAAGDLLMVCTSNGVDEAHTNIPAPRAPSFVGVDKWTGEIVWQVIGPSPNVLHGQWSSPAVAEVKGRTLAFFGGGDGWLYALEASTGREIWRFDGNPKDALWRTSGDRRGVTLRNNIIACPVFHEGVVYLAMGQDPVHGQGQGRLFAIDPRGQGDVTESRKIWENSEVGRMIATPVIKDGLIFTADYNGFMHCLDAKHGRNVWQHDLLTGVWGGIVLAGDHVYVGDEDGSIHVFHAGREKKLLGSMDMYAPIWSVLTAHSGTLYVTSARALFAIGTRQPGKR